MEPVRVEFLMVDGMSARLTQAGAKVDALKGKAKEASTAMDGLDKASEKVRQTIGKLAAAFTAKELVSKIANVRGEIQQLEVAFTTMLGSADKANSLMAQLTETAATTPFGLQEVANGAKQLLAYGTEAEKVNETLIRLGDIAAGLSVPLGDLVYLYGTTMTQGRLYTQDLNQFTGRGIPMIQELAKQFGVAESKVKGLVEEGKVGFPEVQKVIESLTNSGGKFGGLMEAQSKTIAGQINNIEDSIEMMFNNIGQQNEGLINETLGAVSLLVENYEKVAQEILALAGAYGTYKAVVITLSAIEQARLTLTLATGAAERTVTAAEAIRFAMTNKLKAAQEALNATMAKNPYTLVAAAVAGLAYGIYKLATYQTDAEKAQKRLDDATKEYNKNVAAEQLQIDGLFARLKNAKKGTQEYEDAKDAIISQYGTYLNGLDAEIRSLNDVEAAYKAVSAAARDAAKARAMETFTREAADTYATTESEEKEKLYQFLKEYYGDQKDKNGRSTAEDQYWRLVGIINGNGKLVRQSWLKQFDVQHHISGDPETGIGAYDYTTNEVRDILDNIRKAKTTYNTSMDEARRRFGDTPEEEEKKKTANTSTTQDYDYWEKKKKDAESQLKALDASKKGSQEWNKLQEEIRTAQEKMDSYSTSKTDSAAAKQQRQQAKEDKAEERRAQARTDLGEKERALEQENQEEEIELMDEGREKKLREIDKEYQQRAAEIEKKAHDLAEANKKAGETNVNGNGLTEEQQTEIDKANELNEKNRAKQESDLVREDAEAMREYLKQYGTYQQQKLAIAEEYAEKISKAESEGEKKTLEAERDSALQAVEVNAIKQSVDWGSVFGDFGAMFKDQLQPTIEKLRAIAGSDSFKASGLEDQQALYELIAKLEQSGAAWDSDIFKKVGADITAYQSAMQGYNAALEREKAATDALTTAKERLATAEANGEGKTAAQQAVDAAQTALDAASAEVKTFGSQVAETTESLQSSSEKAKSMFENLASGLEGLASGSLKGVGQGVMTLDKLFGGNVTKTAGNALAKGFQGLLGKDSSAAKAITEALGDTGLAGEIISAVLGILDLIAEQGISGIITSLQDTILGSVDKMLEDVLSGDIITKPLKNAVTGVGSILDTVTFGGFSSLFGNGDSDKHLAEDMERLSATNEALQFAIEELTSVMEDAATKDVASMYEQQTALLDESEANMREQMSRTGAAYSNGVLGIGGHKSSNHKINKGTSGTDWSRISQIVGRQIDNAGDWWSLTSEEMRKVATDAPDLYAKIKDFANDGYKDAAQYMDTYIEFAEQREELEEAYYEKLTGFSLDSLREEFKDFLTDATMSWSDMSENFNEILVDSIAEALMTDKYDPMIKALYEKWAKFMEDGVLTEEEQAELQADKEAILESMKTDRASLSSIDTGSGTSQTGKSGSFTTMTQDQGTKLEGMFTSGLQHWSSMDTRMEDVAAKMDLAEGHLAKIEENTGVSASHLNEIKEDLKKVIRDGLKMK